MRWTNLIRVLLLLFIGGGLGCAPALHSPDWQGITLQPGRYLSQYFKSPDFSPAPATYHLEDFPLEQVKGLEAGLAARLFQEELRGAMKNNGLNLKPEAAGCILSGQVSLLNLGIPALRWLGGRSNAHLLVTGEIRQGQNIVFAFQDRVNFSLPIDPRRQSSLEPELIARRVIQQFAYNLLNELLLPSPPVSPPEALPSPPPVQPAPGEAGQRGEES
jgi:hypothetical protein